MLLLVLMNLGKLLRFLLNHLLLLNNIMLITYLCFVWVYYRDDFASLLELLPTFR